MSLIDEETQANLMVLSTVYGEVRKLGADLFALRRKTLRWESGFDMRMERSRQRFAANLIAIASAIARK